MTARTLKFLRTVVPRMNMCSQNSFANLNGRSAQDVLNELSERFKLAKISEPSMSAKILVGEVLGVTNIETLPPVIKHSQLNQEQSDQLSKMALCRLAQMPIQYILGYWEFRNIKLKMRPPVFIPRPETEELAGLVLNHLKTFTNQDIVNAFEIGCGSGAISLSLIDEYQSKNSALNILAIDQSSLACKLTLENAIGINMFQSKLDKTVLIKGNYCLYNSFFLKLSKRE